MVYVIIHFSEETREWGWKTPSFLQGWQDWPRPVRLRSAGLPLGLMG